MRMAPSTDFSASRLCGSVRAGAASSAKGLWKKKGRPAKVRGARSVTERRLFFLGDDADFDLRGDVAMNLHRHGHLAKCFDRFGKRNLALVDLEALRRKSGSDVCRRHRP